MRCVLGMVGYADGEIQEEDWRMMIGEKYSVSPIFAYPDGSGNARKEKITGKIIYIHHEERFAVLEFGRKPRAVRESFWPEELEGNSVMGV